MNERAVQIRILVANPTLQQKRSVLETVRLECVFRHDEIRRYINSKCDTLTEGSLIEYIYSSMAILQTWKMCDIVAGILNYR
jgi:hypothetical protein